MGHTLNVFRVLIASSLTLSVLAAFADTWWPDLLPKPLEAAYEAYLEASPGPSEPVVLALAIVSVGVFVAALGLMLLKPWARALALWTTLLSIMFSPAFGAGAYSGLTVVLIESAAMLWGAALAMAYFSELRSRFETPRLETR
ncbi:MAG TPA: hypothetical protein VF161_05820 [Steroidobacteraceae bacterium]